MRCPLFTSALLGDYPRRREGDDNCSQAECAWWDELNQCCSVKTIAQGMVYLQRALLDIAVKLRGGKGMTQ